jgi:hypothetical protein
MPQTIKATVIEAGSIPLTEWREDPYLASNSRWRILDRGTFDTPPRVLLELSEDAARALAAHLGNEITLEIRP